ncbi:MAG: YggS family pyridoxal phosphate-dependent enzyme [Ginsengibacter sp.]
MINKQKYQHISQELHDSNVKLIAVSKTKPVEDILALYEGGQKDFGENYVQELVDKQRILPKDINWHFIGHLQSNKVRQIAEFVHLIHGVDSYKLLQEINKQALKFNRIVNVLLQVHIASEETKFGLDENELQNIFTDPDLANLKNVKVIGLMGMASFTTNERQIANEFKHLAEIKNKYPQLTELSMGMSSDYNIAITHGSTMVRIGSLLFGARN